MNNIKWMNIYHTKLGCCDKSLNEWKFLEIIWYYKLVILFRSFQANQYILLLFILFYCSQKYGHIWILCIPKCARNFRLRLFPIENGLRIVTYEQSRKHYILSVAQSSIKHNGISIFLFLVFIIDCAYNSKPTIKSI